MPSNNLSYSIIALALKYFDVIICMLVVDIINCPASASSYVVWDQDKVLWQ